MSKVSLTAYLQSADEIAAEKPSYQLGQDGTGGKCDCIGLIIGAIRRAGGSWDGTHGSNYAARNEMAYLMTVTDPDDLNVGEVVYKAAMPGQTNYNLPSRYKDDPDQRDYYHIGIVRSVTPLRIVHCTGPGIVEDTKLGKWTHRGWLAKVSREGGTMEDVHTATVVAETGSNVNLRKTPDGALVDRIPVGATVTVTAQQDGWVRVSYGGASGWMMERFLRMEGASTDEQPDGGGDTVSIALPRSVAEQLRDALGGVLGWG